MNSNFSMGPTALDTRKALEIVMDMAIRYGENAEEGFPTRVTHSTTDEQIVLMTDDEDEREEIAEIRDLWRALVTVNGILDQQGCEIFDGDGSLTDLCDIIIFG